MNNKFRCLPVIREQGFQGPDNYDVNNSAVPGDRLKTGSRKEDFGLRQSELTDDTPQRTLHPTYVYHRNKGGHHSVVLPRALLKGQV